MLLGEISLNIVHELERFPTRYWEVTKAAIRFILSQTLVKKWRRNYIIMPASASQLYVNPQENRGKVLYMMNGVTQTRLHHFWRNAVTTVQPDLVLDVGVNYGECLFSVTYPQHCKIYGVEANAGLKKYIERSRKHHPNHRRIRMNYAIATDRNEPTRTFYVHKKWSGLSSVIPKDTNDLASYETHAVRTITIDALLQNQPLETMKLLFKIDVEGNEYHVLQGMLRTLEKCAQTIGMIEFDSHYLLRAGCDLDQYLALLQQHFSIYIYVKDKALVRFETITFKKVQSLFWKKHVHTDFILVSPNQPLPELGLSVTTLP